MMERRKTGKGSPPGVDDWKRVMRSLGQQVNDPEAIGQALEIAAELETTIATAVRQLHAEGYSWTELARCTGLTRQGVRLRWMDRVTAGEGREEDQR